MEPNLENRLRRKVVAGAKLIFSKGLVNVGEGNLSIRAHESEDLFITPTLNQYEEMIESDVVHLRFDGKQISEGKCASTEYRLHIAVYKARPKIRCVIHTHSLYATMFSVARKRIPVILEEMILFLGGSVNVSEFAPAHTDILGETVVNTLGVRNAILMANHGVLVCGRTMEYAVKTAELVEKIAMIYWGASQIGKPVTINKGVYSKLEKDFNSNVSTF